MTKIFLNAGHCMDYDYRTGGMKDSGAYNKYYGIAEAEINVKISKLVQKYLVAAGVEVQYLHSNNLRNGYDDDLSYPCIVTEANISNCDYAISIHINAGGGHGTETWVHTRNSVGEALGKCIQNRIVNEVGTVDRGIKYNDDLYYGSELSFLRLTDMPAVLVECCFIDTDDVELLLTDEGIDKFARAIACGITDYISNNGQ